MLAALLKLLVAVLALAGIFYGGITGGTAGAMGYMLLIALLLCGFLMLKNLWLIVTK